MKQAERAPEENTSQQTETRLEHERSTLKEVVDEKEEGTLAQIEKEKSMQYQVNKECTHASTVQAEEKHLGQDPRTATN